ncbi:MAG: hypothetical protein E7103_11235 [Prevotella sp.]|nr:hypothetical protein [Prevotella sp.]
MKFCKDMTKDKGQTFLKKTNQQKLLLFAEYEKGEHPFINFCARGYDESEVKDKKTGKMKKGPWRKQKYVHLSGLVAIDIDHVEDPQAVFERWQKEVDFKALKIYLIYVTPRGKGLRVVFRCELSRGNLIDNQMWMCEKLGVEPDASCKDASRGYFLTSTENFLYDDLTQMYADEADEEFIQKYEPEYRAGNSSSTQTGTKASKSVGQGTKAVGQVDAQPVGDPLKWRGYEIQEIINARYSEKIPCKEDSNRHTESLKLATDLLLMLDGDKGQVLQIVKSQPWVQEIIDERNEDVEQTVDSAADCVAQKEKKYAGSLPSKVMLEAVQKVTGRTYQEIIKGVSQTVIVSDADIDRWLWDWGKQIEALAEDFPLIKDICKGLKLNQYPAALFVGGGFLMTLMTRCTYRFYHRPEELRRLNNSTLIIGDPASGKSFATRLYKLLTAPIVDADKKGKEAINAYREEMKTKGANKEKPKKPKVVVRIHPARTSNAQFIQDMVNAVEVVDGVEMQLHMLTFDTELDNTVTVQKGGSWIDKQSLELKAFHNEEDGQAYSNIDSILQDFVVTWNYIYTGTPNALKKKVNEQNFGSGLATRLSCIPLPATNFEMMDRETRVDYESDNLLKDWAYKLDKMKGELTVEKLVDELYDWTARRMADAKDNNSKADEMLLKRCSYHGLNFAAPFIVMRHWDKLHQDGEYWCGEFETDEVDWKLSELIVNIQYACQRHYFGAMAETYFDNKNREASVNVKRQPRTVEAFNRLPDEFTPEDVMRCFNLATDGAVHSKTRRLLDDHLIEKVSDSRKSGSGKTLYRKTGSIIV